MSWILLFAEFDSNKAYRDGALAGLVFGGGAVLVAGLVATIVRLFKKNG